jgi:FSR family fosmidomycin resistance protein-like MFS transporter
MLEFPASTVLLGLGRSMALIILIVVSLGHFLIDLGSGMTHYSYGYFFVISGSVAVTHAAMYNLLAFGAQPVWGLLMDRFNINQWAAVAGVALVGGALVIPHSPEIANGVAATGNALFHLGCGAIVLRLYPGKAWPLGIFVGPGAVGIALSSTLARDFNAFTPYVIAMLVFLGVLLACLPINTSRISFHWPKLAGKGRIVVLLLLVSTLIRSYGGLSFSFPWRSETLLGTILMFTVALGKMAGGFAADRNRMLSIVIALGAAAPLTSWLAHIPAMGILGVFLFQSTMAISLIAIYEQLPEHPAFAFGILCLGLWIGTLLKQWIPLPPDCFRGLLAGLILMSMLALGLAIKLGGRRLIVADSPLD